MGSSSSNQVSSTLAETLSAQSGFSRKQIQRLHNRFCHLDKGDKGSLRRSDLEHISELQINPLGVRIIDAFFPEHRAELTFTDFIMVLAIFRPGSDAGEDAGVEATEESFPSLNSRDEKLRFVFNMYDVDNDGVISRTELSKIFQMMVGVNVTSEQLHYVLELTLEEANAEEEGTISFDKFKEVMEDSVIEEKLSIRFFS